MSQTMINMMNEKEMNEMKLARQICNIPLLKSLNAKVTIIQ